MSWGDSNGIHFHQDDHFYIPDLYFLKKPDQEAMLSIPPIIKERYQRFQIYYHINVARQHEDVLLGGFHIEEEIYGNRYYYPNLETAIASYGRRIEPHLPEDVILLLLTARPEVIRQRMKESPHTYPIVASEDVDEISTEFENGFEASLIERKLKIDASDTSPDKLFATFMKRVIPVLDTRDLLLWRTIGQI